MDRIPPLGWIALAFILIITIGVNVNMLSMLRDLNNKKNPRKMKMKMQRPNTMVNSLQKARDIIRDPLAGEGDKYNELAGLVKDIKAKQAVENNQTDEADPNTGGPKE